MSGQAWRLLPARLRWLLLFAGLVLLLVVYNVAAVGNICIPVAGGGCEPQVTGGEGIDLVGAIMAVVGGIVAALAEVAAHIVGLLPDMPDLGLPDMSGLVTGFSQVNAWLPLAEGMAGLGLCLTAANASFIFRAAVTVWHLIPKPFAGT